MSKKQGNDVTCEDEIQGIIPAGVGPQPTYRRGRYAAVWTLSIEKRTVKGRLVRKRGRLMAFLA